VPNPEQANPEQRGINWPAVAKTFLMQVAVLLGLAVALVSYIEWSSDAAFEEFVAAGNAAPDTQPHLASATPVHAVKGRLPCARKPLEVTAVDR
jgi:hypothetical protein